MTNAITRARQYMRRMDFQSALRLLESESPSEEALKHSAYCYYRSGNLEASISKYEEWATKGHFAKHDCNSLLVAGYVSLELERYKESVHYFNTTGLTDTESDQAFTNHAVVLSTCEVGEVRDGHAAAVSARTACELTNWKCWKAISALASGCAEIDVWDDAMKYAQLAIAEAPDGEKPGRQERLRLYIERKPLRLNLSAFARQHRLWLQEQDNEKLL